MTSHFRARLLSLACLALLPLSALVLGGCVLANLHITGDEEAIGATLEIDGIRAGTLSEFVYQGSTSDNPIVMEREREFQRRTGLYPGTKFAAAQVYVPDGVHDIRITSGTGKTLSTRITMRGENYIGLSFRDMTISE